jgi:hypothetical protein
MIANTRTDGTANCVVRGRVRILRETNGIHGMSNIAGGPVRRDALERSGPTRDVHLAQEHSLERIGEFFVVPGEEVAGDLGTDPGALDSRIGRTGIPRIPYKASSPNVHVLTAPMSDCLTEALVGGLGESHNRPEVACNVRTCIVFLPRLGSRLRLGLNVASTPRSSGHGGR